MTETTESPAKRENLNALSKFHAIRFALIQKYPQGWSEEIESAVQTYFAGGGLLEAGLPIPEKWRDKYYHAVDYLHEITGIERCSQPNFSA